jgi:Acyl-CoA dehydrogenase, C-terminal domain
MGIKASDTRSVSFKDVRVAAEDRLGDVGQGFKIAREVLNSGRLGLAAASARGARAIPEIALAHARQREQFGRPIGSFEMIQRKFASLATEVYAADAAWMVTAGMVDRGGIDFSLETAACKVFGSELVFRRDRHLRSLRYPRAGVVGHRTGGRARTGGGRPRPRQAVRSGRVAARAPRRPRDGAQPGRPPQGRRRAGDGHRRPDRARPDGRLAMRHVTRSPLTLGRKSRT